MGGGAARRADLRGESRGWPCPALLSCPRRSPARHRLGPRWLTLVCGKHLPLVLQDGSRERQDSAAGDAASNRTAGLGRSLATPRHDCLERRVLVLRGGNGRGLPLTVTARLTPLG